MRGEGFNFVMGEVVIRWGRDVDDFQWAELIVGGIWCRWGGGISWFRGWRRGEFGRMFREGES